MAPKKGGSWTADPERAARNGEHLEAMETKEPVATKAIVLPTLDIRKIEIRLVGDSELITHNWSEKAVKQMLGKQMGEADEGREPKDPLKEFLGSLYTMEPGKVIGAFAQNDKVEGGHPNVHIKGGRFGFPAIAFKNAAVEACTSLKKSISKVAARQAFHVIGELVEIHGQPRMRQDMVRLAGMNKTADIRFRAGFPEWHVLLRIRYNHRLLTDAQIMNLFNTAGFAVGVGEWRSERDGGFGLFHVE